MIVNHFHQTKPKTDFSDGFEIFLIFEIKLIPMNWVKAEKVGFDFTRAKGKEKANRTASR